MACPELAGCRFPAQDGLFCAGYLGLVSVTENVSALDALAAESLAGLPSFLPEACADALKAFTCGRIVPGCSRGNELPMCSSTCQRVRDLCGTLIIAMMPGQVQQDLDCGAYAGGSWPQCAEFDETSDCFASSCSGTRSLQDRPCGFCDGYDFTQLSVDVCGVCNGDNTSCSCDGLSGASYDACGACGGSATACRSLETDPRMLGYLCVACCALALVAAALVVVRRQWQKQLTKCYSGADRQACATVAGRVAHLQSACFSRLGRFVARYPWSVITASVVLSASCGSGLLGMQVDDDVVEIWVPYQAESVLNRARREALTAQPHARTVSVLLAARDSNFSSKDSLIQALKVHKSLTEILIDAALTQRSLLGACASPASCYDRTGGLLAGSDSVLSPLQLWGFDDALTLDPDPVRTLKSAVQDETSSFQAASLAQLLAWDVEKLQKMRMVYMLDGSSSLRQHVEEWEKAARQVASTQALNWPAWDVHVFSQRGLADDLEEAVDSDVNGIILGYCTWAILNRVMLVSLGSKESGGMSYQDSIQ